MRKYHFIKYGITSKKSQKTLAARIGANIPTLLKMECGDPVSFPVMRQFKSKVSGQKIRRPKFQHSIYLYQLNIANNTGKLQYRMLFFQYSSQRCQ
jgi:hypothetical protein